MNIARLSPKRPIPAQSAHHIGSPPTSFRNPWPSFHKHTPWELLIASRTNRNFHPLPSTREDLVQIQSPPTWGANQPPTSLKATWIGHASFLIEAPTATTTTTDPSGAATAQQQQRGIRVFFDPVFSDRTSPVSFAGPKRYTPTPCTLDEVPDVDLVVVSHDHYDHMDSAALVALHGKRRAGQQGKGRVHFLVPLGNKARLVGFGIPGEDVTELDWWEGVRVAVEGVGGDGAMVEMTCTPSQHSSGRGIFDQGSTLWCSWVLEAKNGGGGGGVDGGMEKRVFFSGDTGYRYVPQGANEDEVARCPAFIEIAENFVGGFDLSLLPIGLYSPRHICSPVHCTPEDSICLHKELKSKKTIGMHYGTVRGGISQYFEEVTEPPRRFEEAAKREGLAWGTEVGLIDVGQTAVIV